MASIRTSAIGFARGLGGAIISAFAAITDPLGIAKMMGLVDPTTHWTLGETAMRGVFLAVAVIWAFHWYHSVQKQLERGVREPDMPLHEACRWIARDSVWAANYRWPDDQWAERVHAELFSKWQLGQLEIMGVDRDGNGGTNFLPPAMKGNANFEAHKLVMKEAPHHIWTDAAEGGSSRCFYSVHFDRREVVAVWPKRGIFDRLRGNSPVERIGDYAPIFRKQDEQYAKGVTLPHRDLKEILNG